MSDCNTLTCNRNTLACACNTLTSIHVLNKISGMRSRWVIIGPANSGKSVLFNGLTGAYSIVANYPQTTVEATRQRVTINNRQVELVDTPGLASLRVQSPDEEITLNVLIKEKPDGILFCGDAMYLKQSLMLLVQILELEQTVIFCLNKEDEAASHGVVIDSELLSVRLDIPVIEMAAEHGIGLDILRKTMEEYLEGERKYRLSPVPITYPSRVEEAMNQLVSLFPVDLRPSRARLLLFLQGAEKQVADDFTKALGVEVFAQARRMVDEFRSRTPGMDLALFQAREAWAKRQVNEVMRQARHVMPTLVQKLAWASRHPVLGWPIFFAILWLTFKGVGLGATDLGGWLDTWIFSPITQKIGVWVTQPFLQEFLVGQFGVLTMGVANAMVTVVPILAIFFLIVNFLEDVGYLPNLSVLANRVLTPMGLTGKAVLPMVLGTGCNTTATMASRILETRKERLLLSFLVALGVPCSVQMGILLAILATMPFSALLIVLGVVTGTTLICGLLMNHLLSSGEGRADFILELPSFHWPHGRNILRKTYYRLKWFLLEAIPMFAAAAVAMFILQQTGLLNGIKTMMHPLVTNFLALPDKATEVLILVLARREVGAIYFKNMVEAAELDYVQIVTGLVVITLFVPCVSNTMIMIKEYGLRWGIVANLAIVAIAFLVGGAVNYLLRLFI
ncbi:Ferrous iron transport protein B [Gammaproteobacteria bacterium]